MTWDVPATIHEAIEKHYGSMTAIFIDFDRVAKGSNQLEYELILRMSDALFLMRQIENERDREVRDV